MSDPYKKVFEEIADAFTKQMKMILWVAESTLSVKDYNVFIHEFTKKHDDHDELIDFVNKRFEGKNQNEDRDQKP